MYIHKLYNYQLIKLFFFSQPEITGSYGFLVPNEAPPILSDSVGQPPPHSSNDNSCVG